MESADAISGVLEDTLAVSPEEVRPEAHIEKDLGAESIDHLDIVFHLEKACRIKFKEGDFPSMVFDRAERPKQEDHFLPLKNAQRFGNTQPGTVERLRKVVEEMTRKQHPSHDV